MSGAAFDTHSSVKTLTAAGRAELRQEIAELRRDLAETKADILKWMFGMIAGAIAINVMTIIGAMLALVRILGH